MDSVVKIRNAFKTYGRGKEENLVLNNFSMTIPAGAM